jgi:hypothetical protein
MCLPDVAVQQAIETAVQTKVANSEMFTVYDITKAARSASGLQFRHNDVKDEIHTVVGQYAPSYMRQLIDLPGVPVRPFLYFPQGSDPALYNVGGQSTVTAQNIQAASQNPAPTFAPASPSNDPDVVHPDTRGRLWIPSSFIAGLGVSHPSPVYVTETDLPNGAKGLQITTAVPAGASKAVEYIVDRHANIAISAGILVDAGINGNQDYKVEGTATAVTVRVA